MPRSRSSAVLLFVAVSALSKIKIIELCVKDEPI